MWELRSQRVTKIFSRLGIPICLAKELLQFCAHLKFSELWVQCIFFFFKPFSFSGNFFFLYSFHLLSLIVSFLALLLFTQDLEVFDKICFPPVPAKFLSRLSCPLCLPVQDTWHLQHETWISCLTERQVCSALSHWAFAGGF